MERYIKQFNDLDKPIANDKPMVSRMIFPISFKATPASLEYLEEVRAVFTDTLANRVAFKMHNNSSSSGIDMTGPGRPSSAYYSVVGGRLYLEYGLVDTEGVGKLHDFLRDDPDYKKRKENPITVVRSGHVANLILPGSSENACFVLLDSAMHDTPLTKDDIEYFIATTFLHFGIVPLTSDGYPVELNHG